MNPAVRKSDAGFSLLELLVAISLLAFLSLVLFGGLKFGRQVWKTAAEGTVSANAVRVFQDELRNNIERAHPLFIQDPVHPHLDFDGGPSQLAFLAPPPDGGGGLERFVVGSVGGTTMIAARPELANLTTATYVNSLKGVGGMRFAYFGQIKGEADASWHDEWRGQTRLPRLIRISALPARGVDWPVIVVSPHIAADQSCVYDQTTGFCHER